MESITIVHQAVVYREQGELGRTVDCKRRALPCLMRLETWSRGLRIYRDIGDRRREAETLWQLGTSGTCSASGEEARSRWHGAQVIFSHLGVPITDRRFRSVWV